MAIEVGGRKVDLIIARIQEADEIPEYATILEPTFLVKTDDKKKVANEIARKVIEIISDEFDTYDKNKVPKDMLALREFIVELLENPPIDPEHWTTLLPSEIAYVTIEPYKITDVIE